MRLAIVCALAGFGCAETAAPQLSDLDQSTTVCGTGPTVKGMDVSVYQGTINWAQAKADGIQYAIIRVSDGLNSPDSKFDANWSGSRAAGVIHGAYQFFEPGQDPIAQADMLLAKIGGKLAPDDLPPTIDVEVTGGLAPAQVAAKVKQWIAHVKAKVGRDPIVYTGMYFWRDSVGGANVLPSVLFHAQYTTAACPNIADPWPTWAFWQYTSSGSVAGISGNVDVDRWNGTLAQLKVFLGPPGTCGDNTCDAGESKISCPEDCGPCGTIDATGGTVDNGNACFEEGGPLDYMRDVSTDGNDGNLIWTHTTDDATEANYGQWNLFLAAGGHYKVEVYTAAAFAQSKQAKYVVHGASDSSAVLDQSAADGWQTLGEFDFAAGGHQWIHLADNTGEPTANNIQLVFDAVRLTPTGTGDGTGSDPTGDGSDGGAAMGSDHSGCNAGGTSSLGIALALLGLVRRRRPAV